MQKYLKISKKKNDFLTLISFFTVIERETLKNTGRRSVDYDRKPYGMIKTIIYVKQYIYITNIVIQISKQFYIGLVFLFRHQSFSRTVIFIVKMS